MSNRVVAIVGSYRRGGTTDSAVEAILAGAREKGAVTHTIYLTDRHVEFCLNCRECTQTPGEERGTCSQRDDLDPILAEIEASDAIVLGSPINYGGVTAIYRRFLERLLGYAYWPWGQAAPKIRNQRCPRKAVLVASSGMPGFLIPLFTGVGRTLNQTAGMLGARTVGRLWIGLSAMELEHPLSARQLQRARRIGWKLA
jgi:putative NADPH-quinone reductase